MSIRSILPALLIGGVLAACGGQSDAPALVITKDSNRSSMIAASAAASITLPGKRESYTVTAIGTDYEFYNTVTMVATRVTSTARVRFLDYTVGMDLDGNAGKVFRLYQAAFNRVPDIRGLSYWIEAMDKGFTLPAMATQFVASAEFKSVYGTAPSSLDIVSRFYQNVLHRDGESAGISYWVGALQNGNANVAEVLAGFSESAENKEGVYPAIKDGVAFRETDQTYVTIANAGGNKTAVAGAAFTLDASDSMGATGGALLTYQWAIASRPTGSTVQLVNPGSVRASFTPDAVGSYTISLTVSDGQTSAKALVAIGVIGPPLNFAPLETRYSKGLNRLVIVSTNPNTVKIIDPSTSVAKSVALPLPVKSFSLSPDGKLASILHESIASTIDLESGTLLKSFATGGSHTDVFITNSAVTYLIGQSGGQWVRPSVVYFNGRTGQDITQPETTYMGMFYGTQTGIFASTKNQVFLMSQGLSPADIDTFTIDPVANTVTAMGESPYHGDYPMSAPLYLSSTEDILFTSSGNYFYTSNLRYAGTFSIGNGRVQSLSNSAELDETLLLVRSGTENPREYRRFTGALFFPDANYSLPVIDGKQSYGLKIFHATGGRRVALVQTGSAIDNGPNVRYYIVTL